jgi:ubiquinone/menaquinone biosynthesis C-methylase UbiE
MATRALRTEGWQLESSSAEAYERYLASAFSPWAAQLVQLADVGAGDRVLDVGCGTGIVARHAARQASSVVGLDLNQDMLAVARSVSGDVRPAIEWRHGDASGLPFPPRAFDVVFCQQAMQFFSDPVRALGEMHRVLAAGGRAAISVCRPIRFAPAYVALSNALDRHVGPDAGAMMRSPFPPWEVKDLRDFFARAGFRDVHVRIEIAGLRYPSCQEFLRQEAASSPLAAAVGALTDEGRRALLGELEAAIADHVDDDGVLCVLESYVVVARA